MDVSTLNAIMVLMLAAVAATVLAVRQSPTALRNLSNWALSRAAGLDAYGRTYAAKRNRGRIAAKPQPFATLPFPEREAS